MQKSEFREKTLHKRQCFIVFFNYSKFGLKRVVGGGGMSKKIKLKIVILTILSVVLLYIVTPNNLFTSMNVSANDIGKSSTIGGIEVGKLKDDELKSLIANAIVEWQSEPLEIKGGGSSLQLDPTLINFDIENTVLSYESMIDKPWYAFWQSEKIVHLPIATGDAQPVIDALSSKPEWNIEETASVIMNAASMLSTEPVEAVINDISFLENERLAVTIQPIPEEAVGVNVLAAKLNNQIIGSNEVFSLLAKGEEAVNRINEEGLSFIASLLYKNILNANVEIMEYHPQKTIPTYLEPGLEAFVSVATKENLQFFNRSEQPLLLKFTLEGQSLKAELYSSSNNDSVSVRVVQADEIKPREIVRYTKDLAVGQRQVLQEGKKGLRVFVYRTINGIDEEPIRNYYAPVNRILLKSSLVPVETNTDSGVTDSGTITEDPTNNDDLNIDLNDDGLPDVDSNADGGYVDEDGNRVPPKGYYYNKSGELQKR